MISASTTDRRFFEYARQVGYPAYVDRSCTAGHIYGDLPSSVADFIMWDSVSEYVNTGEPLNHKEAKKRSIHNNYMTLPVVFIMRSTHFASTWGHEWNWAVLAALMLIGAGVRHAFNLRNRGRNGLWILPLAALAMLVLYYVVRSS